MAHIQIAGKMTPEEIREAGGMVRSKWYWPKLLARNFYGILLLVAILWATILGLTGKTHPNWTAMAMIWLVIFGLFGWGFLKTKKGKSQQLEQVNNSLPDWIILENDGVRLEGPNGTTAFQPWRNFKSWQQGKRVVVLALLNGGVMFLPITNSGQSEQQAIFQQLSS